MSKSSTSASLPRSESACHAASRSACKCATAKKEFLGGSKNNLTSMRCMTWMAAFVIDLSNTVQAFQLGHRMAPPVRSIRAVLMCMRIWSSKTAYPGMMPIAFLVSFKNDPLDPPGSLIISVDAQQSVCQPRSVSEVYRVVAILAGNEKFWLEDVRLNSRDLGLNRSCGGSAACIHVESSILQGGHRLHLCLKKQSSRPSSTPSMCRIVGSGNDRSQTWLYRLAR